MAIPGLTIIGESINDSVPSTKKLFDAGDEAGLLELARTQDEGGRGLHRRERRRPLARVHGRPGPEDPGRDGQAALDRHARPGDRPGGPGGLRPGRAGGKKPILNSITSLRVGMFDLYAIRPFMPILLVSEHVVDGPSQPCHTADETYEAAKYLVETFRQQCRAWPTATASSIPASPRSAATREGNIHRLMAAMDVDPRRRRLRRRPHLGGPEQLHRHAAARSGPTARR